MAATARKVEDERLWSQDPIAGLRPGKQSPAARKLRTSDGQ